MDYLIYIAPIVVGLLEIVKMAGLNTRFAPVVGLLFGVGLSFAVYGGYSAPALFEGLLAALTAMGFYSGVKSTIKG